jgi:hypothetical protein
MFYYLVLIKIMKKQGENKTGSGDIYHRLNKEWQRLPVPKEYSFFLKITYK